MSQDRGKSSTGMSANLAAALSYVFGLITGLIFFLLEKESKFVKFHAMQSIIFSVAFSVLAFVLGLIPFINLLVPLLGLAGLVLWIILIIKAYQGQEFKLPLIGDMAAKNS